jgi:hypothetical protein
MTKKENKIIEEIFQDEVKKELKKIGLDRRNKIGPAIYQKAINKAHKNLINALGK